MSHAIGLVRFLSDGLYHWFEYNGTSDVCRPKLYKTNEELWAHWREEYEWPTCECGRNEPAALFNDYGGGDCWKGRACRHCMCITAGFDEYDTEEDGVCESMDQSWARAVLKCNGEDR